jgi:hypothetical protein
MQKLNYEEKIDYIWKVVSIHEDLRNLVSVLKAE